MELKDSKTKINLMRAFAGESQARNRYDMAASYAKKEGFQVIESVFKYTACQEKAHAKVFYDFLRCSSGENIQIDDAAYPIDIYDSVEKYLKAANHNEMEEHDVVYKSFSDIAKEEGFDRIAVTFQNIAKVEKIHGNRFEEYYIKLTNNTLFNSEEEAQWMCTNCGYIFEGKAVPLVCPVCAYPRGYFMAVENNMPK
ncbi:MAG: rubrerythrin family protein [Clostridiales bacterium]|nr:rubrerythrin family protein [Clostridiales bacterium]